MKMITQILFSIMVATTASCQETRTVKVTVKDETQSPVVGVQTTVTFLGYSGDDTQRKTGLTDDKGFFSVNGTPPLRMNVRLEKKGFYNSKSEKLSRTTDHDLVFVLRRIKKPIALYAKRSALIIPVLELECGYDFKLGDWVAPHGKGKKSMCFFRMETNVKSDNEHTQRLIVTFPNEGDGIKSLKNEEKWKESDFKWLYEAPENGYLEKLKLLQTREPKEALRLDFDQQSFALRVNTQLDKKGNVVSANYVRIDEGVLFFGALSKTPGFKMTYYYNPTSNDRNLEFAPKRNLFHELDSQEQVKAP